MEVHETKDFITKRMVGGKIDKNYLLQNVVNYYREDVIPVLAENMEILDALGEELFDIDTKISNLSV